MKLSINMSSARHVVQVMAVVMSMLDKQSSLSNCRKHNVGSFSFIFNITRSKLESQLAELVKSIRPEINQFSLKNKYFR